MKVSGPNRWVVGAWCVRSIDAMTARYRKAGTEASKSGSLGSACMHAWAEGANDASSSSSSPTRFPRFDHSITGRTALARTVILVCWAYAPPHHYHNRKPSQAKQQRAIMSTAALREAKSRRAEDRKALEMEGQGQGQRLLQGHGQIRCVCWVCMSVVYVLGCCVLGCVGGLFVDAAGCMGMGWWPESLESPVPQTRHTPAPPTPPNPNPNPAPPTTRNPTTRSGPSATSGAS